jgi:ABC-type lipoprotein export system ATPase subunit
MSQKDPPTSESYGLKDEDVERQAHDRSYLDNSIVKTFSWTDVNVFVPDRDTKKPKQILTSVSGHVAAGKPPPSFLVYFLFYFILRQCGSSLILCVRAGETLAIMGPSGCGKTTLLNVLAHRQASAKAQVTADILVNNQVPARSDVQKLSSYVECDDALIGSLTVGETMYFAAQLSLSGYVTVAERKQRIEELIQAFGLTNQTNTIIGTLVKKGISTGQKRRVSVAAQLISAPKILFLDEPTSGLDSEASFNVMSFVRDVVKAHNLIASLPFTSLQR